MGFCIILRPHPNPLQRRGKLGIYYLNNVFKLDVVFVVWYSVTKLVKSV
jgi:hypothetical protein